jgi:hypothetical protein
VVRILEVALLLKIGVSDTDDEQITKISNAFSTGELSGLMKLFLIAEGEIEAYPLAHIPLILAACKYCGDTAITQSTEVLSDKQTASEVGEAAGHFPDEKRRAKKGKMTSIAQVETLWGEFLSRMKPVNAHLVAILRATKPIAFDGSRLTLVAFWRFHKDRLEQPKILSSCEKILEEVLGQKIRLKIDLAKSGEKPPKVVSQSNVVEVVSNEDLVSVAAEIFSK